MIIKQLSVFLENKQGRMCAAADLLAQNNINIRALSLADTADFGILRLIVNDNQSAIKILEEHGYLIKAIDVIGVKIGDEPGELSSALAVLDKKDVNVEYLYAFMTRTEKHAYVVLRVEDNALAEDALVNAGFKLVSSGDVCKL